MNDDDMAVAAQVDIQLDHVRAQLDGLGERTERILRLVIGRAAMGDNPGRAPYYHHLIAPRVRPATSVR